MDDKNFSDLGRQMSDDIQEALRTGDFSQLKQTVNSTVNTVVDKTLSYSKNLERSVEETISGAFRTRPGEPLNGTQTKPPPFSPPPPPQGSAPHTPPFTPPRAAQTRQSPAANATLVRNQMTKASIQQRAKEALYKKHLRKASSSGVWGVFKIVLGFLGAIPLGAAAIALGATQLLGAVFSVGMIALVASLGTLCALFVSLSSNGVISYNRSKRLKCYLQLLKEKNFCQIDKMAEAVQKPVKFVKKELHRMLSAGMFPAGHMDEQQTCLMLGDDTYNQYLAAKESLKTREEEQNKREQEPDDGISGVISEGKECLRQIREANDSLPGAEISSKLYRLETVIEKIFAYVEQHPNKLPEIRRFMNYYLPTTIKLVNSYQEFDAQPVQGENIVTAKAEILEILDTINSAFETLLDSLFGDDAMDISTDISALKTMLAQEGLAEKDFKTTEN